MHKARPNPDPEPSGQGTPSSTGEPAATSQGMPARSPRPQSDQTDHLRTPEDASVESSLELPHERDQATDMTADAPDPQIRQAAKDVARGITDTSKATELDATYRKLGK